MKTPLLADVLEAAVKDAIKKAFPALETHVVEITPTSSDKFGHYQCNSAMKLSKELGQNPRVIAQKIVDALESSNNFFEKVEIAGPGFINMTFSASYLSERLNTVLRDPRLGIPLPEKRQRIIIEFSSPNIAKEMHVGHLRSTIIGDALARLFEFLGHDVVRLNHIGDWGTAFGMLIAYLQEKEPEVLSGEQKCDLPALMHWYRESKKRFDEDEAFKTRARQRVVALQSGETQALKAWEKICEISRMAFQEIYDILDVKLNERGESFYNPYLPTIVADLEAKGLVTLSDGAKCVFHEGFSIPLMIQKSDGGYNYDTTDVAAMWHRVHEEKADRIIVSTDAGQSLHFQLVYATAVKAHYLDPQKVRFDHVTFGVVLGPDGKKFRTRAGETEKLIDLLTKAIEEAKRILLEREHNFSSEEIDTLATILGIDAVKYSDLSCNRVGDYLFSYERMLRFEGNTAAFILYSFVRVAGIKRKVGDIDIDTLMKKEKITLAHPSEIALGLHLLQFGETLKQMTYDLLPNHLTDYLYLLAQKFNVFFRDCRVEGSNEQNSRLLLCEAVAKTMQQGLTLLGLKVVDRM